MNNVFLTGQLICRDKEEVAIVVQHLPLHIELTLAEEGCVSFEVRPTRRPGEWQVEEKFRDADAFRAHQKRVTESEWGRVTAGMKRSYTVEGM
ncbi:putative quinol monooxygenase [Arthrobacter rhizosphaerae]|uniref:putative quinol monooxygenase n=1 Tax=Arthrobacter rhizosphaerae TaxID=2855490 RepID=UPI001FF21ED9|nr:antibiotic biosynthesis monooxygenase [Arthrobacter rhizosphaerae]